MNPGCAQEWIRGIMKSQRSKNYFGIQCLSVIAFILFEGVVLQYMLGFFESKFNLFLGIVFSCVYGISVLYDFVGGSTYEEENFRNRTSQRNK